MDTIYELPNHQTTKPPNHQTLGPPCWVAFNTPPCLQWQAWWFLFPTASLFNKQDEGQIGKKGNWGRFISPIQFIIGGDQGGGTNRLQVVDGQHVMTSFDLSPWAATTSGGTRLAHFYVVLYKQATQKDLTGDARTPNKVSKIPFGTLRQKAWPYEHNENSTSGGPTGRRCKNPQAVQQGPLDGTPCLSSPARTSSDIPNKRRQRGMELASTRQNPLALNNQQVQCLNQNLASQKEKIGLVGSSNLLDYPMGRYVYN